MTKLFLYLCLFICPWLTVAAQTPSPKGAPSKAEARKVASVIERAEAYFQAGQNSLRNKDRVAARKNFDAAVETVLMSGFDVRDVPNLQMFYLELVEKIYRLEVPSTVPGNQAGKTPGPASRIGFREQKFEPGPIDGPSKLVLTPEEMKVAPEDVKVEPESPRKPKTRARRRVPVDKGERQPVVVRDKEEGTILNEGWTILTAGRTLHGIRYDTNSAVIVNDDLVMGCTHDPQSVGGTLYVSRPSPLRKLVLALCSRETENDEAYIIDTVRNRVVSRDVVPKHWHIIKWIRWSPDERFALVAAAGEVTQGDMAFVDLRTGRVEEIHFKTFTNNPQLKQNIMDEIQDFDSDGVAWVDAATFRLRLDVYCNPYQLGDDQCDSQKVLRSYPAQVNLNPFGISYGKMIEAVNTGAKQMRPARAPQPVADHYEEGPTTSPSNTLVIPTPQGDVRVRDFYKGTRFATDTGSVPLRESGSYQIDYSGAKYGNMFYISLPLFPDNVSHLKGWDFDRTKAETDFLNLLRISKQDACKLKINLGFAGIHNDLAEIYAGRNFGLSFCPDGEPIPPLPTGKPKKRSRK